MQPEFSLPTSHIGGLFLFQNTLDNQLPLTGLQKGKSTTRTSNTKGTRYACCTGQSPLTGVVTLLFNPTGLGRPGRLCLMPQLGNQCRAVTARLFS